MKDLSKLAVFSRGFLQDALTLMNMMDMDKITKRDIRRYIKKPKKSGKRNQFGKPVGNPKPLSEKRGCKGCKEKEDARLNNG